MAQVVEGVSFIPGQDEFIPDSHVYVVGNPASEDLSLVDAGLIGKGDYKIQSLLRMGIDLRAIKRIIMTHTHLDHIGCLHEIQKQIPWAELWIHASEADPMEKGDERTVYGMDVFKEMCQMQYGLKPGDFTFPGQIESFKGAKPWISAEWNGRSFTFPVTPWEGSLFTIVPVRSLSLAMSSTPTTPSAALIFMGQMPPLSEGP